MGPRGHFSYRFVRWRGFPGPPAGKRPLEASFGIHLYAGGPSLGQLLGNGPQRLLFVEICTVAGLPWATGALIGISHRYVTPVSPSGISYRYLLAVGLICISHRYHVGISYRYLIPEKSSEKKTCYFLGAETLCSYDKKQSLFLGIVFFSLCKVK